MIKSKEFDVISYEFIMNIFMYVLHLKANNVKYFSEVLREEFLQSHYNKMINI